MKCEIAKMNTVLIQHAFDYYAAGNKNVFTFKSLYNDEEPYSLEELITCLNKHIQILEAEQQENTPRAGKLQYGYMRKALSNWKRLESGE
ncbi:hypothetical protein AP460_02983 [Actinobacillus pleuropneumoniae]|nr:hypothetical protein AP460_02983 [Actinobacillus pleuropneumoniae]